MYTSLLLPRLSIGPLVGKAAAEVAVRFGAVLGTNMYPDL